jgi:predicted urease superfamily metal-dependent hydrolase
MQKQFLNLLNKHITKYKTGYIESVLSVCDDMGIAPEQVVKYLSKPIIEKIRAEGESINLLPPTPKLPI